MWVNLGCGEYYWLGWINVDWPGSPHPVDQRVDLTGELPFEWAEQGLTRIYAGHLFEHLTVEQGKRLLERLLGSAKPGCDLMIVGPDVNRATEMNQRGELDDGWLRLVREGGNRWPGDRHLWECEPNALIRMCADTGWVNIREVPIWAVPDVWPLVSDVEWQCAVQATA